MNYKRIFYDYQHNKIHHWYLDDEGKTRHEEISPKFEYYVPDKTGASTITDIYGNPVVKQFSEDRDALKIVKECGKTFEANIPQDIKFLQKTYGNQDLKCNINDFQVATIDIEVSAKKSFPKPEEASFPINLISIHLSKSNELYTFGLYPYTGNSESVKNYHYCADEKIMIEKFIEFFRKAKIEVLTGWFVRLFDLPYIIKRCENLGIEKSLSPLNIYKKKNERAGYHTDGGGYEIAGISTLDGIDLFKNFTYEKQPTYNLNAIGLVVVGEGKLTYDGTINTIWETDWNKFVEYNVQDVVLTRKIEEKKKHIELAINLCYQSLVPFEKVFSSLNLITGSIIKYAHQHNMVLPDSHKAHKENMPGAFCMAKEGYYNYVVNYDMESLYPTLIRYYNISPETLVMKGPEDIIDENLLIKTPLSEFKDWDIADGQKISTGGIYYRRDKQGILPRVTEVVFNERKKFKKMYSIALLFKKGLSKDDIEQKGYSIALINEVEKNKEPEYYKSQQQIRKIWINSLYGQLGCEFFSLYNFNNAISVTLNGQQLIRHLGDCANRYIQTQWINISKKIFGIEGKEIKEDIICLTDTDSCNIHLHPLMKSINFVPKDNEDFRIFANKVMNEIFTPFFKKVLDIKCQKDNLENIFNFKREKIMSKMFILAKKKYAFQIIEDEDGQVLSDNPKTKFKGIEMVRTDTPDFSRKNLKSVIAYIFDTEDKDKVIEKIRTIKTEFLQQSINEIAIPKSVKDYTKYAKDTSEYIKNGLSYPFACPIHVRASINYNYMLEKYKLPYQQVYNGNKMKYVHVMERKNELHQDVIGFIGNWPSEFNKFFEIDYEKQWERGFQNIVERFFDVLKWGKINLETNTLCDLFE